MRFFLSALFSIFTLALFCQNKTCSDFKNGEFKYSNSKYAEWTVNRTDSVQIEVSSKTGIEIHSLVEWKSNCEYVLTCKRVLKSDSNAAVGKVFHVVITETFIDRYKCVSKKNEIQLKDLELEMIKIK